MKDLKIRASSLGRIMTLDNSSTITAKQLATLNGLLAKIKLTEKQAELRNSLEAKRDAKPVLSTGAKSYIRELALEDKFGIKLSVSNKYVDKGNLQEQMSIELAEKLLDCGALFKNEQKFENDYVQGTPDVITDKIVIDVKTSWSKETYFKHYFEKEIDNKIYEWQLKAYMWLTGKTSSYLSYCLVPTDERLIIDDIRRVSWKRGEGAEVLESTEREVREYHSVDNVPVWCRVTSFKVDLTDEDIKRIKLHVELAREYYNEIINAL